MAELSKLKADMKRSGHVSSAEAASLRRSLAQREDELNRMRRSSAEPPTPRVHPPHGTPDRCTYRMLSVLQMICSPRHHTGIQTGRSMVKDIVAIYGL